MKSAHHQRLDLKQAPDIFCSPVSQNGKLRDGLEPSGPAGSPIHPSNMSGMLISFPKFGAMKPGGGAVMFLKSAKITTKQVAR